MKDDGKKVESKVESVVFFLAPGDLYLAVHAKFEFWHVAWQVETHFIQHSA